MHQQQLHIRPWHTHTHTHPSCWFFFLYNPLCSRDKLEIALSVVNGGSVLEVNGDVTQPNTLKWWMQGCLWTLSTKCAALIFYTMYSCGFPVWMNVQLLMGLSHKPQCSYSLRHPSSAFDPYVELISNPLERDDSIKQRMSFFFSSPSSFSAYCVAIFSIY